MEHHPSGKVEGVHQEFAVELGKISADDLALAGGKGANLGELIRARFPVPAGFVVTTAAYDRFVAQNRLNDAIDTALAEAEPQGGEVRAAFKSAPIPSEVERSIIDAYQQLGEGAVAVRSSATAEDLPGAAFAGQQDSYLNIVGSESLLDAVRQCWASLWTDRAIAYRAHQGIGQQTIKLAAVVQQMVMADFAGVMFTANPITGERKETVIDASPGLGEAVVSGQVTPDQVILRKGRFGWHITERRAGRREVIIRALSGGGTEHITGGAESDSLPDSVLRNLARLGARIEQHFGRPQDVEWACADGRLFIVQARPITALPEPLSTPERLVGNLMGEMLPTRPYPLDVTAWMPALFSLIEPVFRMVGMAMPPFQDMFSGEDGISERPPQSIEPKPTLAVALAPFRIIGAALRYDPRRWQDDPLLAKYLSRTCELEARDLASLTWEQLLDTFHDALAIPNLLGEIRRRYFPGAGLALLRLRAILGVIGKANLTGVLISGTENQTIAANRALEALAARIRSDPALAEIFERHDSANLWAALEANPVGHAFLDEVRSFLYYYGHREAAPLLVSTPTWKDAPEVVLGMLKAFAQAEPQPHAQKPSWEAARDEVLARPLMRLAIPRRIFLSVLERARTTLQIREDTHFYGTMGMPIVRRTVLEMGRRLAGIGVLDAPEEVFHLTRHDLESIAWPPSPQAAEALHGMVQHRIERRAELERRPYHDPRRLRRTDSPADALVSGTPGSPGVAEGTVRVIHDQSEFGKLRAGDVLVAPFTNPAWTPLFQRAVAVVVDSGGAASHAAIVAREYGIPAVMATTDGTHILTDGQHVRVDGSQGFVLAANSHG